MSTKYQLADLNNGAFGDVYYTKMKVEWWHMFGGPDGESVTRDISLAERGEELCRITAKQAEELAMVPVAERWQAAQRMMQGGES